jgi:hypothetical protein
MNIPTLLLQNSICNLQYTFENAEILTCDLPVNSADNINIRIYKYVFSRQCESEFELYQKKYKMDELI